MRCCLLKVELGVRTYSFLSLIDPNCPKLVFKPQTPNFKVLKSKTFHVKVHKILHKTSPYFQNLVDFWRRHEGFSPRKLLKSIKKALFGSVPGM